MATRNYNGRDYTIYTPGSGMEAPSVFTDPWANARFLAKAGYTDLPMATRYNREDGGPARVSQALQDYLASKGYQYGISSNGDNVSQMIFDSSGNPVSTEDYNSGGMAVLAPLLIAGGVAGIQALGGLGGAVGAGEAGAIGAGEAGAGVGTLGAGGTTAGQFVAQPLTVLGPNGGLSAASAASIPTAASQGFGAGSLDYLLGSGIAGAGAGAAAGGSSATKAALYGAEGYGTGMTGAQTALYDGTLGLTGSKTIADLAVNNPITGGLSNLMDANSIKDIATNPLVKYGLTGLGALAGASDAGNVSGASVQSKMDPRMDQYVYGSGYGDPNSLLGAALAQFKANPSGINPLMQQGLDMAKSALTDPAYSQTYRDMRSLGTGLLNMPIAGNPFTQGRKLPNAGGLLGNGNTGIVPPPDVGIPAMKALPYMGKGLL